MKKQILRWYCDTCSGDGTCLGVDGNGSCLLSDGCPDYRRLSELLDSYRRDIVESVPCQRSGITLQSMDNTWRAEGWDGHCDKVEAWKKKKQRE